MNISYDLKNDAKVFVITSYKSTLGKKLNISACTTAGSRTGKDVKPNEDAFSVVGEGDVLIAAVFDGNSSLKPIKSLGEMTGARYASHFLTQVMNTAVNTTNPPQQILQDLNMILLGSVSQFTGTDVRDIHTLPATSVTIAKIDFTKQSLEITHIGDTFCIVFYKVDSSEILTIDKIKPFDDAAFSMIIKIAKERNIYPNHARKDERVTQMLTQRYQEQDNRPDGKGYGILNGQPEAIPYIQTKSVSLEGVQSIFLGSDGIIPLGWNVENNQDRKRMLEVITKGGLQELITLKKSLEDNDPEFEQYVRYKHSDDATGILIEFTYNPFT